MKHKPGMHPNSRKNLILKKPGDPRPPGSGRAKGTQNRSTVARKWLEVKTPYENPATGLIESLTQEEIMHIAIMREAQEGDTKAYNALMNTRYGPPQTQKDIDGKQIDVVNIKEIVTNAFTNNENTPAPLELDEDDECDFRDKSW